MGLIKGIPIILHIRTQSGLDELGVPIYEDSTEIVNNVLVAPSSTDDITSSLSLTGKKAVYTLGIPKGDTHTWEDTIVEFFGKKWRTFGFATEGIESMIPLSWNKKVMVERYED